MGLCPAVASLRPAAEREGWGSAWGEGGGGVSSDLPEGMHEAQRSATVPTDRRVWGCGITMHGAAAVKPRDLGACVVWGLSNASIQKVSWCHRLAAVAVQLVHWCSNRVSLVMPVLHSAGDVC